MTLGKLFCPVCVVFKARLVGMSWDIAANTRIRILKPRTALRLSATLLITTLSLRVTYHIGILVIDGQVNTRQLGWQ